MRSQNHATPPAHSRRELIRSEQTARKSTARPPFARRVRSKSRAGGALAAIALLVGTYALPAYAFSPSMAQSEKVVPEAQSFAAPETSEAARSIRDQFSISKALPANAQPYSRIADTFSNNPTSLVNWPLAVGAPISSPYGWRTLRGASNFHTGLDINPGLGTPIQAIAEGTVIEVGNLKTDSGTYVLVEHQIEGDTVVSLYAHMLENSPAVAVGDQVARSQVIGNVGCTGNCTGPHVHLELTVNGDVIDPYPWMKRKVGS